MLPKYKYTILQNTGKYLVCTDIVEMDDQRAALLNPNEFHKISNIAAYTVNAASAEGKLLGILPSVLAGNQIEIQDLIQVEQFEDNPLSTAVAEYSEKATAKVFKRFNNEIQFHLYNFQILNTKFASLGLFITPENKQEIYIKIIEMDDETLLDDLEAYLDSKNIVDKMYADFKRLTAFKQEIAYAKTEEEIQDLWNKFELEP